MISTPQTVHKHTATKLGGHNHFVAHSLPALLFAMLIMLGTLSCGSGYNYKEKTDAERKESYHKELTTTDLSLFELKGNVQQVVYPNGFLSQYVSGTENKPDTVSFSASGVASFFTLVNGDTLKPVRMTNGAIVQLMGKGQNSVSFNYSEEGEPVSWAANMSGKESKLNITYVDNQVSRIKAEEDTPAFSATVKILQSDEIGNWTKRQIQYTEGEKKTTVTQSRQIVYY